MFPYDLRKYYPQFDDYYLQDLIRKKKEKDQEIQPSDLRGDRDLISSLPPFLNRPAVRSTSKSWDVYSEVSVLSRVSTARGRKPKKNNQIEMIAMNPAGEPPSDTGGVRVSSPSSSEARTLDELKSVSFQSSYVPVSDLESRTIRSEIGSNWMGSTE